MKKNLIVAQSGGPSVAINATLAGVIAAAQAALGIDRVYGGIHGVEGIQAGKIVDLTDFHEMEKLKATPAMALGSCRCKLPPVDQKDADIYQNLRRVFAEYDIG